MRGVFFLRTTTVFGWLASSPLSHAFVVPSSVGNRIHSRDDRVRLFLADEPVNNHIQPPDTPTPPLLIRSSGHDQRREQLTSTATKLGDPVLSPLECWIRTLTLLTFIASMCVALPVMLLPVWMLQPFLERTACETLALDVGQATARILWRIMPFCRLHVDSDCVVENDDKIQQQAKIWVCNHTSMLDTFVLLAADRQIRGRRKRPIKTVYWKGLEDNPICNLLFHLCGFIPVDMEDNGSGNPNQYNRVSFKHFLKPVQQAFEDGFDLLILPEGQLNPDPTRGSLSVFTGAHRLSRVSHRPVNLFALYGCHEAWSATRTLPYVQTRDLYVRGYAPARRFASDGEFVETFRRVAGTFGGTGTDVTDVDAWLDGSAWKQQQQQTMKIGEDESSSASHDDVMHLSVEDVEQAITHVLEKERLDSPI